MVQMVRRLQRTLSKQTRDAVYTLDALTLFQCNDRIFVFFQTNLFYDAGPKMLPATAGHQCE